MLLYEGKLPLISNMKPMPLLDNKLSLYKDIQDEIGLDTLFWTIFDIALGYIYQSMQRQKILIIKRCSIENLIISKQI